MLLKIYINTTGEGRQQKGAVCQTNSKSVTKYQETHTLLSCLASLFSILIKALSSILKILSSGTIQSSDNMNLTFNTDCISPQQHYRTSGHSFPPSPDALPTEEEPNKKHKPTQPTKNTPNHNRAVLTAGMLTWKSLAVQLTAPRTQTGSSPVPLHFHP